MQEISIWDGLLQGLIQGLTEFLPVSSSGHLSLYQALSGKSGEGSLLFSLLLHLGTLAAVIAAYYEDLWLMLRELGRMLRELVGGRFRLKTDNPHRKLLYMLFIACLPMVLALFLNGLVKRMAGDGDIVAEGVCFLVTAGLLFLACKVRRGKAGIARMKPRHALTIGVMQAVAAFPGISRSGATISTGLVLGFDRSFAVKFSFLLGIPAILGGAVFEIGDAAKEEVKLPFWPLFLGMLTAAVVGYLCIKLIRWLLLSDRFVIFAWYTLALGIVVIVVGVIRHLVGAGAEPSSVSQASGVISDFLRNMPAGGALTGGASVSGSAGIASDIVSGASSSMIG